MLNDPEDKNSHRKLFRSGRWWGGIYGDTCWGCRNNHLLNLSKFKSDFRRWHFSIPFNSSSCWTYSANIRAVVLLSSEKKRFRNLCKFLAVGMNRNWLLQKGVKNGFKVKWTPEKLFAISLSGFPLISTKPFLLCVLSFIDLVFWAFRAYVLQHPSVISLFSQLSRFHLGFLWSEYRLTKCLKKFSWQS